MTYRRILVAAAALSACALMVAGCGDSDPGTALSTEDWVTFEGKYASVRLPDSFVGGDPADLTVMAALFERAASIPDSDERASVESDLNDLHSRALEGDKYQLGSAQVLLAVFGEPGAGRFLPAALVSRSALDERDLVQIQQDRSIRSLVDGRMHAWPESEWRVESLAQDRASVAALHMAEGADDMTIKERLVLRVVGTYVYEFDYMYFEVSDPHLDAVFAASAETIIVNP